MTQKNSAVRTTPGGRVFIFFRATSYRFDVIDQRQLAGFSVKTVSRLASAMPSPQYLGLNHAFAS